MRWLAVTLLIFFASAQAQQPEGRTGPVQRGAPPRLPDAPPIAENPPPAPAGLVAAQTSAKEITLSWQAVPGAREYRIHTDPPLPTRRGGADMVAAGNATRAILFVVAVGRTQRFWIETVDARGQVSERAEFNPVTAQAATGPAQAPSNVTASQTGAGEVTLSWSAVPGATAYALGRAIAPQGFQRLCDPCAPETTYVDRSARPGAEHTYTVTAITPSGRTAVVRSNTVKVGPAVGGGGKPPAGGSPVAGPRPQAPTRAEASVLTPETVELSWRAGEGQPAATGFSIYRSLQGGAASKAAQRGSPIATLAADATQYTDNLPAQIADQLQQQKGERGRIDLHYEIVAVASGAESNPAQFRMDWSRFETTQAPGAPTQTVAKVVDQYTIRFTWMHTGAAAASFAIDDDDGRPGARGRALLTVDGKAREATLANLPPKLQDQLEDVLRGGKPKPPNMRFVIRAINRAGESKDAPFTYDLSEAKYVKPGPPEAPANAVATVVSENEIRLSWTAPRFADGYVVERVEPSREVVAKAGATTSAAVDHPKGPAERELRDWLRAAAAGKTPEKPPRLAYRITARNKHGESPAATFTIDLSKARLSDGDRKK
jgi:hypothetical protein